MNSPLSSLTIQAKPGLEGRDGRMDLVAIERHPCFQAQCVARAQAARFDAEFLAGVENVVPNALGMFRREIDFEAIFAGVSGASDAGGDAGDQAVDEVVVTNGGEIGGGQLLQSCQRVRALDGELGVTIASQFDRRR